MTNKNKLAELRRLYQRFLGARNANDVQKLADQIKAALLPAKPTEAP